MNNELIFSYVKALEKLDDREYLQAVLKYNISPVMERKKPSAIITLNSYRRNLKELWEKYHAELWKDEDLKWMVLRRTESSVILIIYRLSLIKRLINNAEVRKYLKQCGYDKVDRVGEIFEKVKERYRQDCPHEIGILLGIPVKDVEAFVKGRERPIITTGYWMVYYNVDEALRTFAMYDSIREKAIYDIIGEYRKDI